MLQVHLLSLPWASPQIPSIQIGALKAYLKENLPEEVAVHGHHLHLNIITDLFSFNEFHSQYLPSMHEGHFLYLLLRRFGHHLQLPFTEGELKEDLLAHFLQHPHQGLSFLEEDKLRKLQLITEKHLENSVVTPAKNAKKVVIGMPTNFLQTFANVYAYFYLRERLSDKELTFVFGGSSMSYPQTTRTFQKFNIDAFIIIGEGEKKFLSLVQKCLDGQRDLNDLEDGVFHVQSAPELTEWKKSWYSSQIKSISELPLPDFQEFFDYLVNVLILDPENVRYLKMVELPMEGSRGCVFTCEFCNLNRFWQGYRKLPGEVIAERAQKLLQIYPSNKVRFVDNLCDGWAEQYADELISKDVRIRSIMELRPKHKDQFYKKLAQSGLRGCQIGIEGLDTQILKRVGKGTNVPDVIHSAKSLCENGVIVHGNILAFYPHSTLEEASNTRRVLKALLHLPKFTINRFWLGIDSPIYSNLTQDQKKELKVSNKAARSLPVKYGDLNVFFYYEPPKELEPAPEVMSEWKKLIDWYSGISPSYWMENYLIMEAAADGGLIIHDRRNSKEVILHRPGSEASAVLLACHEGKSLEQLVVASGLTSEEASAALKELLLKDLVLQVEQTFISLPLKLNRDDLQQWHEKFLSSRSSAGKLVFSGDAPAR